MLGHTVRSLPATTDSVLNPPSCDLVLVDGREDLPTARALCRVLSSTGIRLPLLVVVTEGGLAAVSSDWGIDDVVLATAGPGEADARKIGRASWGEGG